MPATPRNRRLPEVEGEGPAKTRFKSYPIGFFHIDIAEVQTAEGKLCMFVAIDRTSKFAVVELHLEAKRRTVGDSLRRLVEAVPYRITIVLTDNGRTSPRRAPRGIRRALIVEALAKGETVWAHAFEYACAQLGMEHRTAKSRRRGILGEDAWQDGPGTVDQVPTQLSVAALGYAK